MIVKEILYWKIFQRQFEKLPAKIQEKAIKAEDLFKQNPLYPSLRLHKLHGRLKDYWSISVDIKYRIIFYTPEEGIFIYISIGKHSIYEY